MMSFVRPFLFRKVAIIGVGLIGGSLGKAIKKFKIAKEVAGLSQHAASLEAALKDRAIDVGHQDIKKAVQDADLVVLATPVSIIAHMLSTIGPHLKRNCIVTDVGSTKASIVNMAQKSLPTHVFFIGSHPLAGSEKRGIQHAREDLFVDSLCLVTPAEDTHRFARERIRQFWTKVGAKVKELSPEEHDKALAYVSHLPHVLTYALMEAIPEQYLGFAAQGLKDTTRVASSSPQVWSDICMGNSKNIVQTIDELVAILARLRKAITSSDQQSLVESFKSAKEKRDKKYGSD